MEQGSLAELQLSRSVIKHIKKQNKQLIQGTGIGHDFASARCDQGTIINAEAVGQNPQYTWVKAFNNFYVSGGQALYARIIALLPVDTKESEIKEYMQCFNQLAEGENVQLAGGHTQVSSAYKSISFVVNVTGTSGAYKHSRKSIMPGCDILMFGYTGMLGTDIITREKYDDLRNTFSESYIKGKTPWNKQYSVKHYVEYLLKCEDVYYMHDISHGGVYAALWQLGAYANRGISVGHFSIPIIQETIEFCEVLKLNPYLLEGTGAMLAVVKSGRGEAIADTCREEGISCQVIGHVEANNDRMIYLGDALTVKTREKENPDEASFFIDADNNFIERRCLSPLKGDEIYKVVASI